jgi:hypothetical protein
MDRIRMASSTSLLVRMSLPVAGYSSTPCDRYQSDPSGARNQDRRLACYSFKLCAHHSAICSDVGPGLEFRLHHFVYANRCRDIAHNWRWHHNFIHKCACRCTIGGMLCGYVPCTRHSQFCLSMNYNNLYSSWPFLGSFTY